MPHQVVRMEGVNNCTMILIVSGCTVNTIEMLAIVLYFQRQQEKRLYLEQMNSENMSPSNTVF